MRTTILRKASVERAAPYDVNFHGLIDQNLELTLNVVDVTENSANLDLSIKLGYVRRDDGTPIGTVTASATIQLTDCRVPTGKIGEKLGLRSDDEEFNRLIEGAVAEEVLLPLSVLARAAKMPISLPIPIIIRRPEPVPAQPATVLDPTSG